MSAREREDTDDLTAPATLEDVQAHASGQHVGQSETSLELEAEGNLPATPDDTAQQDSRSSES